MYGVMLQNRPARLLRVVALHLRRRQSPRVLVRTGLVMRSQACQWEGQQRRGQTDLEVLAELPPPSRCQPSRTLTPGRLPGHCTTHW